MNQNISKEQIKEIILNTLEEMKIETKDIILFGSRAKNNYTKDSDWDILIVTSKTYGIKEKMEIVKKTNKKLAKLLIPSDIIVNSLEEIEEKKDRIGCITKFAIKEGIKL